MHIEQIYTGCLAQGAYYIVSGGEAVIIDPLRETDSYLKRLEKDNVKLKYIFETHFHADFVSGHLDLSRKTGAPIVYGPTAQPAFEAIIATDGQIFKVGEISFKALHTPGHTMESTTYLLLDKEGREIAIFSGDTLFLGDVGRPDLAQKAANMTTEALAGMLYDSLNNKILTLPDDIIVYPAHGAGSACGKNMMKETVDTLGNQKQVNYALNQPDRETFIQAVTEGLTAPPGYFGMNVAMNKTGYSSFDDVLKQGMRSLSPAEFREVAETSGALILDTRDAEDFSAAFVPQSINIGLKGDFAPWVGAMIIDVEQPLLLVIEPGQEEEAVTRLSRVGFDHSLGYLEGGITAWKEAGFDVDAIERIDATELITEADESDIEIIDVRKEAEYEVEHHPSAQNKPLDTINDWFDELSDDKRYLIHCAGGYRSMIAASILQSRGYRNISEVRGGFKAIQQEMAKFQQSS
ncbi:MAG TPA: MBL fold metallo-hydrolase [Saprospiraceae bacterium]|nr:MBL fold metallo-hydrolase [Saprospiraceae bacterium]HQW55341.1 MBL fold metallo-hydrolase [Saprospiraceae bacterium]